MLINTAGGITSGDEYNYDIEINKSNLCISTQAAEKIYSGFGNPANLEINLNLLNNSSLFWLPKELILFNNCNLKRKINFNLSKDSNLFLCENIIFGRTSMKEIFEKGYFSDFWNINIDNKLIVRLLSKDSYNLKFAIDKILSYFFEGSKIPKIWKI